MITDNFNNYNFSNYLAYCGCVDQGHQLLRVLGQQLVEQPLVPTVYRVSCLLISLVMSGYKPLQQIHQVDVLVQIVRISLHVTETVRHLLSLALHSDENMGKYQQRAWPELISHLGGRRPWIPSNCLSSMVVAIPLTNLEMDYDQYISVINTSQGMYVVWLFLPWVLQVVKTGVFSRLN